MPNLVNKHLSNTVSKIDDYDSFDELILDFPDHLYDSKINGMSRRNTEDMSTSSKNRTPNSAKKRSSWLKKSGQNSNANSERGREENKPKEVNISLAELPNETFVDDLFDESSGSETDENDVQGERSEAVNIGQAALPNETFINNLLEDSFSSEAVEDKVQEKRSKVVNISLAELPNETFVDDLFEDSNGSEGNGQVREKNQNFSDVNDLFDSSGLIMADSGIKKMAPSRPKFVDDLFEDTSDPVDSDVHGKAENKDLRSKSAEPNQSTTEKSEESLVDGSEHGRSKPTLDEENKIDSDCELFPPSPETIPKNRLKISSSPWKSLNNLEMASLNEKNSRFLNFGQNSVIELDDNFFVDDETINTVSRSAPVKSGSSQTRNSSRRLTFDKVDSSKQDNGAIEKAGCTTRTSLLNHSEIPSAIFDDLVFESASTEKCNNPRSTEKTNSLTRATSPVLFSTKKTNRRRSLLSARGDQSTSIKFDSFFDISEENLQRLQNHSTDSKITAPLSANNKFSCANFDDKDDIFVNTNNSSVKIANGEATTTCVTTKPPPLAQSNHSITFPDDDFILDSIENSKNLIPGKCSTPEGTEMRTSTPIRSVSEHPLENKQKLYKTSPLLSGNHSRFERRARRSIPLFSESDLDIHLHSSQGPQQPQQSPVAQPSNSVELKQRLYNSFKENVKHLAMISRSENVTSSPKYSNGEKHLGNEITIGDDNDDDFQWLQRPAPVAASKANECFKKPSPVLQNHAVATYFSPANGLSCQRTPTRIKKKRVRKKRNLVSNNLYFF